MDVTYRCPRCEQTARVELPVGAGALVCTHCGQELAIPEGALVDGDVTRCLACPSTELFLRKDFPQRLGVTIVVLGLAASCVAWNYYYIYLTFGILFATALADLALYLVVGDCLNCYRCGAQYRGVAAWKHHGGFDLATHERYRQQAARLEQTRGSAGAK